MNMWTLQNTKGKAHIAKHNMAPIVERKCKRNVKNGGNIIE